MISLTNQATGHTVTTDKESVDFWKAAGYRGGETTDAAASEAPAKSDNKAAWVDYAVTQGADRDDAEASTKADLVERYGA